MLYENEELIGYSQVINKESIDIQDYQTEKPAEIRRFYVKESAFGTGASHFLMSAVLRSCLSDDVRTVWLGVWENNFRAQKFYKKFGFEKIGEHSFKVGNQIDTDHILALKLKEQTDEKESGIDS